MFRIILTLFLSCICALPVHAKSRVNLLSDFNKSEALKNSTYSVYAKYIGGKDIIKKDKNLLMPPASVLKLFTTSAVLDMLGNKTFETKVYLKGKIVGGTIVGDIYIVGGGDPSFGSIDFDENNFYTEIFSAWARELKKQGITQINGNIYADNSLFSGMLLPWYTSFKNVGNYFAPKADALSISNNTYKIVFPPTKKEQKNIKPLRIEPQMKDIVFQSSVYADEEAKREGVFVSYEPVKPIINLDGFLPVTEKETAVYGSLPNPAKFAAESMLDIFNKSGIKVLGFADVKKGENYEQDKLLFTHTSPTLAELVKHTNKRSDNLYAEVLLRDLSVYTGGEGNADDGLKKLNQYLEILGLNKDEFDIYDASGLSYQNNVSCQAVVTLLEKILDEPYAQTFKDSLVIAGNNGEKNIFGPRVKNKNFAFKTLLKTGALDKARTIAGYSKSKKGKDMAFCFFINNFKAKSKDITALQESFLEYLANLN